MRTKVIHISEKTGSPDEVYIGRPSVFGNPIGIYKRCPVCGGTHDRGGTLKCYRKYLMGHLEKDPAFKELVKGLYGKTLVCYCKPAACHGDILAEVTELLNKETDHGC